MTRVAPGFPTLEILEMGPRTFAPSSVTPIPPTTLTMFASIRTCNIATISTTPIVRYSLELFAAQRRLVNAFVDIFGER